MAIDFDNTIIAYDRLFIVGARERELVSSDFAGTTKQALRDTVRQGRNGEFEWQALQAHVYGEGIGRAPPYPGSREFVVSAREAGVQVMIVSHKTPFAAARPGTANLQDAAREWLCANGFIGPELIAPSNIYFEPSRKQKLERIRALGVQIVIDDLIEILTDPEFPQGARRWLFTPGGPSGRLGSIYHFCSWQAMREALNDERTKQN